MQKLGTDNNNNNKNIGFIKFAVQQSQKKAKFWNVTITLGHAYMLAYLNNTVSLEIIRPLWLWKL